MKMDQAASIIHVQVQNLRTFNEIDKLSHGPTIQNTHFTLVWWKVIH